jgi:STE24 endopeptidase
LTGARRVAWALGLGALTAAWVFAAIQLWRTSVPGNLVLPDLDPRDRFAAGMLEEAASFQRFIDVNSLLATVAMIGALVIYAVKGERFTRESAAGRIGTGMLLGMLGLAFVWIAQFPFGLAEIWWARRHDQTQISYIDWLVEYWAIAGGKFLFISAALLVVMALAGVWRRMWWVAAVPVLAAIALGYAFLQPYMVPGLDRPPAAVEADVEELAADQGISEPDVRVIDTHGATEAPNAFAFGIGPSERVVLFDTLVGAFDREQVRAVIAHELAHLERNHVWQMIGWLALLAVPIALAVAVATRRRGGLYQPAAVPVAVFVAVTLSVVARPLDNTFSQRLEAEADWVALEATGEPDAARSMFMEFTEVALIDPDPPAWSDLLLSSHPSVLRRLEMVEAWREREGGGEGRGRVGPGG